MDCILFLLENAGSEISDCFLAEGMCSKSDVGEELGRESLVLQPVN